MTEHDDLDMLAAEYALGTLDADTRADVATRRQQEPELAALILAWEARLAPLSDEAVPVAPGPELRARIEQRIDSLEADAQRQQAEQTPTQTPDQAPTRKPEQAATSATAHSQVVALRRRLVHWQWSTGLASAAALVLAVIIAGPLGKAPSDPSFIAVFQEDDRQPAFMLSVDLSNKQLHVLPVSAEPLANKSYQLWIKDDSLGPNPRSVGVLNDDLSLEAGALSDYDPALLKRATFGISIEPSGGSPTGQPTGSAIHGYLYPTGQAGGQRL
ncbi:anti-sigma-K factor RskA [Onishia taeanensis]|uniref:Anti-sigma-K factor RskA n=1 Tax=Onishia taeanensis TaxID=284577 RepID=A0A328XS25_9GAMM|nr:anti-sigma factor [Halomonas taeanensis]RAR62782.1 anti-sigma-K factor RskA [Halomonas taeanensis]